MWTLKVTTAGVLVSLFHYAGLVVIAIGVAGVGFWFRRPNDRQIDAWIQEDLADVEQRALAKSCLDKSELTGESIIFYTPRIWDIAGAAVGLKRGQDNKVRFMPLGITVILFTDRTLVVYQSVLDLSTGNYLNEGFDSFFYKDVVGVGAKAKAQAYDAKTLSKSMRDHPAIKEKIVDGVLQLNEAELFELTTTAGNSVSIMVREPTLIDAAGGGEIPSTKVGDAIRVINATLRIHK